MAVIEYKEGEHGGGFVGFRVYTTLGTDLKRFQKYLPIKKYGYNLAKTIAHNLNAICLFDARNNKENNKIRLHVSNKENVIVKGLRANIIVEQRNGFKYFIPCFNVEHKKGSRKVSTFRVKKLGYKRAYLKAVDLYAEQNKISASDKLALFSRMPDKNLFTDYLFNGVIERGHKVSKKTIQEILDTEIYKK